MSTPNGTDLRSASELREQFKRARYANLLKQETLVSQLTESMFPGYGNNWGDMVDPRGRYPGTTDGFTIPNLGQATDAQHRRRGDPYCAFRNYEELRGIWAVSRQLECENELIGGMLRGLCGYIVHVGFQSRAVVRKGVDEREAKKHVAAVQRELDDFDDDCMWPELQTEFFLRSIVDGEGLLHHTGNEEILQVRRVESEQIVNPPGVEDGKDGWAWGWRCDPDDQIRRESLGVSWDGTDWNEIPAVECEWINRNVSRSVMRGLSDLFCGVGDVAGEARKLLEYMRKGATVLAAVAWFEKHAAATKTEVESAHDALKTLSRNVSNPDGSQSAIRYRRMLPGAIVGIDGNKDIQQPPLASNTPFFAEIARLARISLAVRWNAPESLLGDASNGAFASLGIAESPFVRTGEMEQARYARRFRRTLIRVVKHAIERGRLHEDTLRYVDIQVTPPSMVVRDQNAEATTRSRKIMDGYLSPQDACQEDGRDWERTQKDIAAAKESGWVPPGTVPAAPPGATVVSGMFGESSRSDPFAWLRE